MYEEPSKGWAQGWLERHPELKFVAPARGLDAHRAEAAVRVNVDEFINNVEGAIPDIATR